MGKNLKSFEVHVRKSLDCLETIDRNMDIKGNAAENSERKLESYRKSFYNFRDIHISSQTEC